MNEYCIEILNDRKYHLSPPQVNIMILLSLNVCFTFSFVYDDIIRCREHKMSAIARIV